MILRLLCPDRVFAGRLEATLCDEQEAWTASIDPGLFINAFETGLQDLSGGAEDDLVYVHVPGLLDREGYGAGHGVGADGALV